jgi:hypothetical protein
MKRASEALVAAEEAGNPDSPSLPSNRMFVLQFRIPDASAGSTCTGRVEHVASGRAGSFVSWEELRAFVEHVLGVQREGSPRRETRA